MHNLRLAMAKKSPMQMSNPQLVFIELPTKSIYVDAHRTDATFDISRHHSIDILI